MVLCCTSAAVGGFSPLTNMAYSLKPLLMRCYVPMVSGPPNWIVARVDSCSFVCTWAFVMFCALAHIDSHTIYSCTIHMCPNMMYVHCATHVLEIGHHQTSLIHSWLYSLIQLLHAMYVYDFEKVWASSQHREPDRCSSPRSEDR